MSGRETGKKGLAEVAERVRKARKKARLTQAQLAKRIGRSQTLVSLVETGAARVGARYVRLVLAACDLPRNWGALSKRRRSEDLEAHEIAGFDPETLEAVQKGSRRDRELGEKYVWWNNHLGGW
ncbi:MAG TPA: helix-turn-helix transcriptional regulator [Polyangiaceae bacterium]|nr:helix-turn-helix transcriptional regulator [Polyangiaceae bacterium]